MRYLKTFEYKLNDKLKPQVGDYVICWDYCAKKELKKFLKNNIGQIKKIYPNKTCPEFMQHHVVYENIPQNLLEAFQFKKQYNGYYRSFTNFEILHFSNSYFAIKNITTINKYNI